MLIIESLSTRFGWFLSYLDPTITIYGQGSGFQTSSFLVIIASYEFCVRWICLVCPSYLMFWVGSRKLYVSWSEVLYWQSIIDAGLEQMCFHCYYVTLYSSCCRSINDVILISLWWFWNHNLVDNPWYKSYWGTYEDMSFAVKCIQDCWFAREKFQSTVNLVDVVKCTNNEAKTGVKSVRHRLFEPIILVARLLIWQCGTYSVTHFRQSKLLAWNW